MKRLILFLFLPAMAMLFSGCPSSGKKITTPVYLREAKPVSEMAAIHNHFDRFKCQIIGHFSNKDNGTGEAVQEFIVIPIFTERTGEFWVYLEFFSPGLIGRPIDQRIEQYIKVARDTFRMEVHYLKEPDKYINEWKKDKPFAGFDMKRGLIRDENCDLIVTGQEDKPGTFRTLPPSEITCDMKNSKDQAKYVDLEFQLSDEGYLMWFKFYDKNKQRLKATQEKGQAFKRQDYTAEGYKDLTKESEEE